MNVFELAPLLARLPSAPTPRWPDGVYDIEIFERGGLSLSLFAPRTEDRQTSHDRDELYFVAAGHATLQLGNQANRMVKTGSAVLVQAGCTHQFVRISPDFAAWVVFFGPQAPDDARD